MLYMCKLKHYTLAYGWNDIPGRCENNILSPFWTHWLKHTNFLSWSTHCWRLIQESYICVIVPYFNNYIPVISGVPVNLSHLIHPSHPSNQSHSSSTSHPSNSWDPSHLSYPIHPSLSCNNSHHNHRSHPSHPSQPRQWTELPMKNLGESR